MNPNQSSTTNVCVDICMGDDDDVCVDLHHIDPRFSISQERLAEIIEMNDAVYLEKNGGIYGIAAALCSNIVTGIIGDEKDIYCRRKAFGFNNMNSCWNQLDQDCRPSQKNYFREFVSDAFFKDSTIILLLCCGVVSVLIGIETNGPKQGLVDGAIVFLTIFVVVNFGLMSRFIKGRLEVMIMKLKKRRRAEVVVKVSVIRHGDVQEIPSPELVVGDVVLLEAGNHVPADGLFIHGGDHDDHHTFKLDHHNDDVGEVGVGGMVVSVFSGSKVVEGNCRMLVTAVGKNTKRNKLARKNRGNNHEPKLQDSIEKINRRLENLWLILSLLILSVQCLRSFMMQKHNSASDQCRPPPLDPNKGLKNTVEEIMKEYSSTRLMKKQQGGRGRVNGLVSLLCVLFLANRDGLSLGILVLCFWSSRKMNKYFGATFQKLPACFSVGLVTTIICLIGNTKNSLTCMSDSDMVELWVGGLTRVMDVTKEIHSHHLLRILRECIFCVKTIDPPANIVSNCCMSILSRDDKENQLVQMMHWRGAPEFILSLCSHYYDVDGTMQILDQEKTQDFITLVNNLNNNNNNNNNGGSDNSTSGTLLAFACKEIFTTHHQLQISNNNNNNESHELIQHKQGLTLVALVQLKNMSTNSHVEEEFMKALNSFRDLGINVKLVVGTKRTDELFPGSWKKDEVMAIISRSFNRRSDSSPSLPETDIGISMIEEEEEEEDEADIMISGQDIGMVAPIIKEGRNLCKRIETFLELHLILNLSAFALNFVLEIFKNKAQLTPYHLLWTNLVVETLGAFAISVSWVDWSTTAIPPPIIVNNCGGANIITKTMWRNIATQSLFQVSMLISLAMKGKDILDVDENVVSIMIFNCYVLCQIFALIGTIIHRTTTSSSDHDHVGRLKIREKNLYVIGCMMILVGLQVLLVEMMRFLFHWEKLDYKKWLICIGIAAGSVPVGYVVEWISHVMMMMMMMII